MSKVVTFLSNTMEPRGVMTPSKDNEPQFKMNLPMLVSVPVPGSNGKESSKPYSHQATIAEFMSSENSNVKCLLRMAKHIIRIIITG